MSSDPGSLFVRDRKTGRPVAVSTKEEVRHLLDYNLKRRPDPLSPAQIAKFALYFETYAKHIVMAAWLFNTDRDGYAAEMRPTMEKLSDIRRRAKTVADLNEMVDVGMDAALDAL